MTCAHGLIEETCPHCRTQRLAKPAHTLVQPAPTELQIAAPFTDALGEPKNPEPADAYKNNSLLGRSIPHLSRNLSLGIASGQNEGSLFQNRLNQINQLSGVKGKAADINLEMPMENLKKKSF